MQIKKIKLFTKNFHLKFHFCVCQCEPPAADDQLVAELPGVHLLHGSLQGQADEHDQALQQQQQHQGCHPQGGGRGGGGGGRDGR